MFRIYSVIILIVIHTLATAQTDKIDLSSLPTASYKEKFWSLDRWGEVIGNIITVDFRYNNDSTITFAPSLIETVFEGDIPVYILFPSSGSETDVFIYKINGTNEHGFDVDHVVLKEKIFMWGAELIELAIQIDDLEPGYYHVSYASCNYYGSYVLHIQMK